ncbi:putative DNA polymerase [Pseudomonas phage Phabio]|uniref:Putative DNA polymerase n=1 Tax=Pseudomonas phage Phabio TaxID=2006668 RepID=A0A1Y0SZP0_9CAUD|nr:DNA polymerase [Pseudomonas phage Phabio]ARV76698.1 putative DNA polymerase [Pseudomonas phage Phabio]
MQQFESHNPFIRSVDTYSRNLEIVEPAIRDSALYLSSMTGDSLEQCLAFVKESFAKEGAHPLDDPKSLILDKNMNGDRTKKVVTFNQFLGRVKKQNLLLSPSMTVYLPEEVRQSTHAAYIEEGVINRKKTKGEQMRLEGENTPEAFEQAQVKKGEQENYKGNNNSYSGATVSAATILCLKSTHSSLTSTCRTATTYANANNEKFIMGNRHYYNPEITKSNMLSIANATDLGLLERCMTQFNMYYPSPDDIIEMMLYSTKHYWQNPSYTEQIRKMVSGMTPIQRAAIMYVGDLFHVYKHNNQLVRDFLTELSQVGRPDQVIPESEFKQFDGDMCLLSKFICYDIVKGRNDEKLREQNPEVFDVIHATGRNISEVLNKYRLLVDALFMTINVPSSVHAFPSAYRRAAVISDTDSTMFTLQYWVEEFFGRVTFTPEAKRLVFSLVFLVSECVAHILALQSANMGVTKKKLRLLAMKNEYYFAVLSLTTRSKHYYASQDAVEGVMFQKARMEVKGVGLRDSKVPPRINRAAKKLMDEIITSVKEEKPLIMRSILTRIANLERDIYTSIYSGKAEFLTTGKCKRIDAYKSEDNATYAKHLFWEEVMAPSFGRIEAPPYSFVKISVTVDNRTRFNEWVDGIEDKALGMRLKKWALDNNKTGITNFHVPMTVVENMGIPEVITRVADVRAVISNTMGAFYLMLESLNVFLSDKDNSRLISDFY